MRLFDEDPDVDPASIGMHALSTLLMYAAARRAFQFLLVLTGRIASTGSLGGFVVDTPVPDDSLGVLKQTFDGLVEVREVEDSGAREYRVRGLPKAVGPRTGTEF